MVISDLITDVELPPGQVNSDQWCECIDGALTKENYLTCMREAGFEKNRGIRRAKLHARRKN